MQHKEAGRNRFTSTYPRVLRQALRPRGRHDFSIGSPPHPGDAAPIPGSLAERMYASAFRPMTILLNCAGVWSDNVGGTTIVPRIDFSGRKGTKFCLPRCDARGQKRRFGCARVASALPPVATKSARALNAVQGQKLSRLAFLPSDVPDCSWCRGRKRIGDNIETGVIHVRGRLRRWHRDCHRAA